MKEVERKKKQIGGKKKNANGSLWSWCFQRW